MTDINKQKFLAELGKLLTFMYEEDRQTALAMYSAMFEENLDEQAILTRLVSPTRQAVLIARSYNAKERKLETTAQNRDGSEEPEGIPEYIMVIDDIQQKVLADLEPVTPTELPDQISLFGEGELGYSAADDSAEQEPAGIPLPKLENIAPEKPQAEAEESAPAAPEKKAESIPSAGAVPGIEEPEDIVNAFLADFSIGGKKEADDDASEAEESEESSEEEDSSAAEESEEEAEESEDTEDEAPEDSDDTPEDEEDEPVQLQIESDDDNIAAAVRPAPVRKAEPVMKANVALLILYIIFAVPVGLLGIVLLLIPTLLSLAVALAFVAAGIMSVFAVFGGFAVFADAMMMSGVAIILLALGLLFVWIFIWFIAGAMAALVRGLIHLGKKWCYKEVGAV